MLISIIMKIFSNQKFILITFLLASILSIQSNLWGNIRFLCDSAEYYKNESNNKFTIPLWLSGEFRGGDGRSYREGYGSEESFFLLYNPEWRAYPFIDLKIYGMDRDIDLANNIGLGWRVFSKDFKEMIGVNIYYDIRRFNNKALEQIGVGAELLGRSWDIRINGYIPIDKKRILINKKIFNYSDEFFALRKKFKMACWGCDIEVGRTLLDLNCFEVYGGMGPYFYSTSSACCNTFAGGMGRIQANIPPYLSLSLYVTYDQVFHTKVQGEIRLTFSIPQCMQCCAPFFRSVIRNGIILAKDVCCWSSNF